MALSGNVTPKQFTTLRHPLRSRVEYWGFCIQTSVGGNPSWKQLSQNWSAFHILRLEDLDAGVIDDDWIPSRTNRTVRLVVRKE